MLVVFVRAAFAFALVANAAISLSIRSSLSFPFSVKQQPVSGTTSRIFGAPFAVFGLTLSCRQSSFLLFAVPNFQSLVTPLVIFWRLFCSSCAIPLRNIAIFALPGSPGQLFFGVVSFWLCAPPPFNWCAHVNASFLAKTYDPAANICVFHFVGSRLASIFVTRFWWHACHYLIWERSNFESRKFRLRSF